MTEQNRLYYKDQFHDEQSLETLTKALRQSFSWIIDKNLSRNDKQSRLNELLISTYESLPEHDARILAATSRQYAMGFSQLLYLKWWPYFLDFEPKRYVKQIQSPIFALNGAEDIQVTTKNLEAISLHASNQTNLRTKVYPHLNHLFQKCYSCKVSEYGLLTETINSEVLNDIYLWLKEDL